MEEKIHKIKEMAKAVLDNDNKGISLSEYNELLKNAKSEEEIEVYKLLYEYFLGKNQTEVIKDGKY